MARKVYELKETGEFFVKVGPSDYMLDYDYVEGGRVETLFPHELVLLGAYTDAEIADYKHLQEA